MEVSIRAIGFMRKGSRFKEKGEIRVRVSGKGSRSKSDGFGFPVSGFREVKFNSRGLAEGAELVLWLPRPRFKDQGENWFVGFFVSWLPRRRFKDQGSRLKGKIGSLVFSLVGSQGPGSRTKDQGSRAWSAGQIVTNRATLGAAFFGWNSKASSKASPAAPQNSGRG